MPTQDEMLALFQRAGAIIPGGHFLYASGRHGHTYVNKDAIYPHTGIIRPLCSIMAKAFFNDAVEVVVGPEKGGIILSQWVTYALNFGRLDGPEVLAAYAEKEGAGFVLRRGYEKLVPGKRVLVVEDILTTGGSVLKVVNLIRSLGGEVIGVAALCNRGGVTPEDIGNVPKLFSCVSITLDSWTATECPMCAQGTPFNTDLGKGKSVGA
jgi:orotate phosphoribosyltransferase